MDRISLITALFAKALVLKSIGGDKIEFIGVTTTALTEGSTTNPITIDGDTVTAVSGNVAIYGNDAFIFNGTKWQVYSDMSDIETRLEAAEGDIDAIELALPQKADASDVYTKTEVDTSLATKANTSDLTSTNNRVTALESHVTTAGDVIDFDGHSLHAAGSAVETEKTATGNPVIVEDALECNADGLVAKIVPIQSGSGDPSPENVRPISGRTEVNLGRSGKNLLPMTVANLKSLNTTGTWSSNTYSINGLTFEVQTDDSGHVTGIKTTGTSTAQTFFTLTTDLSFLKIGDGYSMNGCPSGGSNSTYGIAYYVADVASGLQWDYGNGVTFTAVDYTQGSESIIRFVIRNNVNVNNKMWYPMIRDAATVDDTYEPYITPVTLTIALGTTVYGGSLNVKTGVLTVDYKLVDLGTLTWNKASSAHAFFPNSAQVSDAYIENSFGDGVCEWYKYDNNSSASGTCKIYQQDASTYRLFVYDDTAWANMDGTQFKTYINGCHMAYKFATPTTIQLTANDLALLMGYNRVTSDSGDITLTYKANAVQDLQNDKADNADMVDFIENGNKASRAYSANQFMLWKGDLYKVTTSIASGATITAGTNVTKTTIGAVLTALLNA